MIAITKNVAKTITAEVRVPPHSNYTESVFLASEGEVLLSTNGSCQLSQTPQDKRYDYRTAGRTIKPEDVKGLPLPWEVPLDSSPASLAFGSEAGNRQSSTYYVAKARKTRVTSSKREDLKSAQNAECANHAIVTTEDFAVSEQDYQKMQEGGLVILKDEVVKRSVIKIPHPHPPRSKPEPKDAWKLECALVSDQELADTLAGLTRKQKEASLFTRWHMTFLSLLEMVALKNWHGSLRK